MDEEALTRLHVKELRSLLREQKISWNDCLDKQDLVRKLVQAKEQGARKQALDDVKRFSGLSIILMLKIN